MAPKFTDRPKFVIKQGGISKVAFDTINAKIDYIIRIAIFYRYELNRCIEMAKD